MPEFFWRPVDLRVYELHLHNFSDAWHEFVIQDHLSDLDWDDAVGQWLTRKVVAIINDKVLDQVRQFVFSQYMEYDEQEHGHLLTISLEPLDIGSVYLDLLEVDSLRS